MKYYLIYATCLADIRRAEINRNKTVYIRREPIIALACKPPENRRKPVRMLTTYCPAGATNGKPTAISMYNSFMGGVDLHDMMLSFYSDERKTAKVWKKMALNIVRRMLLNVYILYDQTTADAPHLKPTPFYPARRWAAGGRSSGISGTRTAQAPNTKQRHTRCMIHLLLLFNKRNFY